MRPFLPILDGKIWTLNGNYDNDDITYKQERMKDMRVQIFHI